MMLTTEDAARLLTDRGVLVKGKGTAPHPPSARTVEGWCRSGALVCEHVGLGKRGMWLVSEDVLREFEPPKMGRKKDQSKVKSATIAHNIAQKSGRGSPEEDPLPD